MYSVKVEGVFSAAHNLKHYKGKCEDLHGHNWKIEVVVTKKKVDKIGMVLDFKHLRDKLYIVLEKLDHKHLNNLPYFKKVNPTSENIARYIYEKLKPQVPGLSLITVWENNTSSATYEE